jgi:hypothetical protein
VLLALSLSISQMPALGDPLNDRLSTQVTIRSGFLK